MSKFLWCVLRCLVSKCSHWKETPCIWICYMEFYCQMAGAPRQIWRAIIPTANSFVEISYCSLIKLSLVWSASTWTWLVMQGFWLGIYKDVFFPQWRSQYSTWCSPVPSLWTQPPGLHDGRHPTGWPQGSITMSCLPRIWLGSRGLNGCVFSLAIDPAFVYSPSATCGAGQSQQQSTEILQSALFYSGCQKCGENRRRWWVCIVNLHRLSLNESTVGQRRNVRSKKKRTRKKQNKGSGELKASALACAFILSAYYY